MTRLRRGGATAVLALWGTGLAVALRSLLAAGDDRLRVPLASIDDLGSWVAAASPPEMAIAVLRLLAVAACAYLLGVTALGVVARTLRAPALAASVARRSPALVRRMVTGGSGAGLALGTLVAALPASGLAGRASPAAVTATAAVPGPADGDHPAGEPTATMARIDGPVAASASMTRLVPHADRPSTVPAVPVPTTSRPGEPPTRAAPGDPAAPGRAAPRGDLPATPAPPAAPPRTATPPLRAEPPPPAPRLPALDTRRWRVAPGDSLWSIAEEVVRTDRPDAPERSVARYWQQVVAANRARLVDPGNPDLLVPGQTLDLPPADG